MAEHVLLIPGLLCSPRLFAAQAAALRRAGHAVTIPPTAVAPDIAAVAESVLVEVLEDDRPRTRWVNPRAALDDLQPLLDVLAIE